MISYITFITAICISTIAAYYSIVGLTMIFPGAFWPVVIMGTILEIGKLVTTSWLYRNWSITPKIIKYYLIFAIAILMFITSIGIFGFLSKAHIEQTVNYGNTDDRVEIIEQKIQFEQEQMDNAKKVLKQIDDSVNRLARSNRIRGAEGAIAARTIQSKEREKVTTIIDQHITNIHEYKLKLNLLKNEQRKLDAEIGPLKYIAILIYGEDAELRFEDTVRYVIILLVMVFDPLAVVLMLASNISFTRKKIFTNHTKYDSIEIAKKALKNMKGEGK